MFQKNERVIKNASWIIACRIVQALLSLVIGMLSARYLGPANYGIINYASSITAFFVPVVQLGLTSTIVHELISDPEHEGKTIGTALAMSVGASILGILGVIAFAKVANRNSPDTIIVCLLYSISLIFQATELTQYWFQSKLLSKYVAVVSLIAYTLVSAYRVFLLITGKSVFWFSLSQALDFLLISVLLLLVYRKLGGQKLTVSVNTARSLFSRSRYYIVSGIMVTLFSLSDRIMITLMIGEKANGYYSAAITCADLSRFVFAAIVDSARPSILQVKNTDSVHYCGGISRLYSVIVYLALAQSIVLTFAAPLVVRILYGSEYVAAVPTLQIITWYTSFAYMGSVRNIWILAEQQQKILWKINLSGAVLNIAMNYVLIPILGINGAAIASVAAQFFTNFVLCLIITTLRPVSKLIWDGINPLNLKSLWRDKV